MKLIIKEYLTSLKERGELDALLPDLLSQMGLRVFSRPGRGTRQYGVDVAAVGNINGVDKVFLLSVKSGDLGRRDWDNGSVQDLRPSLNEILDVYIPNHLPPEYEHYPIDICICTGGDIKENVRLNITQYVKKNETDLIKFVEWDGDHLAAWVEKYFLQENLVSTEARPLLRKSLALLDEPQASFRHFSNLIKSLAKEDVSKDSQVLITVRQMNICLWILFAWARQTNNLESSYLAAELTLLYAWEITKHYHSKTTKIATEIKLSFYSTHATYQIISRAYLDKILPHTGKRGGLSTAVQSSNKLDINLKLFEVLGRLALGGIMELWKLKITTDEKIQEEYIRSVELLAGHLKQLIINNPTLLLPIKDDHAIDIFLALLFLFSQGESKQYIINWLSLIIDRSLFAYETHGLYPCIHRDYLNLLGHPERRDDEYRQEATSGSILYPLISLWAAILNNEELYKKVQAAKEKHLSHCNFQFWYPGETTEKHLYRNDDIHGVTFSHVPVDQDADSFLESVWSECDQINAFSKLSCIEAGMWPLLLVACRHYRLPVPIDFTLVKSKSEEEQTSSSDA